MEHLDLKAVEKILDGKISKNPHRFEAANGLLFSLEFINKDTIDYFLSRGVEFHKVADGVFYTETVMSIPEFERLDNVFNVISIA